MIPVPSCLCKPIKFILLSFSSAKSPYFPILKYFLGDDSPSTNQWPLLYREPADELSSVLLATCPTSLSLPNYADE